MEHKIFKGSFVFKQQDYIEVLLLEAKEIIEFMESKGIQAPILKENGMLIAREDDTDKTDINNYKKKENGFSPKKSSIIQKIQSTF